MKKAECMKFFFVSKKITNTMSTKKFQEGNKRTYFCGFVDFLNTRRSKIFLCLFGEGFTTVENFWPPSLTTLNHC